MSDQTWYLATCQDCTPVLPQPFYDEAERNKWARQHEFATGHRVLKITEVRSRKEKPCVT